MRTQLLIFTLGVLLVSCANVKSKKDSLGQGKAYDSSQLFGNQFEAGSRFR